MQHTGHIGASDMATGAGLQNIQQQMQGKGGYSGSGFADKSSVVNRVSNSDATTPRARAAALMSCARLLISSWRKSVRSEKGRG
jgi:hypothetical protein